MENEKKPWVHSMGIMDMSAEEISVKVSVYDTFATVNIDLGKMTISLFTTNEDEAKAIVAKFVMPEVANYRMTANA
jgi:hypothetical protein